MEEFPENDKVVDTRDEFDVISRFMKWLCEQEKIHLTKLDDDHKIVFDNRNRERLISDYLEIDLDKVEDERKEILKMIRAQH